jgi:hypothetical protein
MVGCGQGLDDCDGLPDNGCEVSVRNDPQNCGACGVACAPYEACVESSCVDLATICSPGKTPCSLGVLLDCADLNRDPSHCGACGNACPGGKGEHRLAACVNGRCVSRCEPGYGDCEGNGVCRDLRRDPYNCGACGNACELGQPCIEGVCATSPCGGTH